MTSSNQVGRYRYGRLEGMEGIDCLWMLSTTQLRTFWIMHRTMSPGDILGLESITVSV